MGSRESGDPMDQFAEEYDEQARACEWYGGGPIFGMMYEYLSPGDRLLDLGIGTGMGSEPFHLAGLRVHGIDSSEAMLAQCRRKGFAETLTPWDMRDQLPFRSQEFDHAICIGVLHFLEDVEPVVGEASRVLREGGTFGVTTICPDDESRDVTSRSISGVTVYEHSHAYMEGLLSRNGLRPVKTLRFIQYVDASRSDEVTIRVHIAVKGGPRE